MPDTEHIKHELKKFDNFTKEKKPHGSWMAGALQLGAWFATGILLLTYSITNTNAEWPFGSQIIPFPSSVLENKCFPYPDIKCIHKQGCLFFPDFLKDGTGKCYYAKKGSLLPLNSVNYPAGQGQCKSAKGNIQFSNTPVMYDTLPLFSVLQTNVDETITTTENALEYTMTEISEYSGELSKSKKDSVKEIPIGMSTLNVIRTKGAKLYSGEQEVYDTWMSSLSTLTGRVFNQGCCNSQVYESNPDGTVTNTVNAFYTLKMKLCDTSNAAVPSWFTTHINAPFQYALINVKHPLEFSNLFGLIGGWVGSLTIMANILFVMYKKCLISPDDEIQVYPRHVGGTPIEEKLKAQAELVEFTSNPAIEHKSSKKTHKKNSTNKVEV